eukprot:5276719-Amphidinium_carterae.1
MGPGDPRTLPIGHSARRPTRHEGPEARGSKKQGVSELFGKQQLVAEARNTSGGTGKAAKAAI